jgi:hypothetical protein
MLAVKYPSGKVGLHQVQSTACPTAADLRGVPDFETWRENLRLYVDTLYNADAYLHELFAQEDLLDEARAILSS